MQIMMKNTLFAITLTISTSLVFSTLAGGERPSTEELERLSKQGKTLSAKVTARFPPGEQRIRNDTGINVLVDLAHQATFVAMWELPRLLRRNGFRACASARSRRG